MKTSESLWQYDRDESASDGSNNITDFPPDNNDSISFTFKEKPTSKIGKDGIKGVEIMVPLKYLRNFWRTFEMLLTQYEINLQLKWSAKCFLVTGTLANEVLTFRITDKKLHIPDVTLSTQNNKKLLKQ